MIQQHLKAGCNATTTRRDFNMGLVLGGLAGGGLTVALMTVAFTIGRMSVDSSAPVPFAQASIQKVAPSVTPVSPQLQHESSDSPVAAPKPAAPAAKQQVVTQRPPVAAPKPAVPAAKQQVVTQRPPVAASEPAAPPAKQQVVAQRPPVAAPKPAAPAAKQQVVTQRPPVAAFEPAAPPAKQQVVAQRSPVAASEPAAKQQVVTQRSPVAASKPASKQQFVTQSSGSGETNTTNVVGNEARNIVTGTNASVTINENHRIQSMTPQSKAVVEKLTKIEGMENRLSKTVLSAVKKVNDQSLDKLKKTTELALNRHLDEQQVIVKIADATNEYGVYVLDSDTNVYRPLGKVIQTLVRTDLDSPPEGDETVVSPNVATPTEGDETTAGSSEAEPSTEGGETVVPSNVATPTEGDETTAGSSEAEPPTEGDETTAGSSPPNTGDTNEVDAGLMFEDKSGVKDDLPPSANEQSSSEVWPYRKRIIDPTNGVG
jgi:hypothetical protein